MKHTPQLSPEERITAWLDLCDVTFRLMKSCLDGKRLEKRLCRMREEDVRGHTSFLTNLGKADP